MTMSLRMRLKRLHTYNTSICSLPDRAGTRCVQALMVSAVSSLMDPKPGQASSVDDYIVLDPKAQAGKASADAAKGPFREAIVFVIGGGNYLEQARLSQWALSCTPPKHIIYGTTEMLSGAEFCAQLAVLGKNSVGASSAAQ